MADSCASCRFYFQRFEADGPEGASLGVCRRHAPTIPMRNADSGFPAIWGSEWCGDFEPQSANVYLRSLGISTPADERRAEGLPLSAEG